MFKDAKIMATLVKEREKKEKEERRIGVKVLFGCCRHLFFVIVITP